MIICNKCGKYFNDDSELTKILITVDAKGKETGELYKGGRFDEGNTQEVIDGCPNCLTDEDLGDIEDSITE